ncbi:MAG TPA: SDR family oxidoreductase [Acidimicrobiales bacterium]|nr:SDR family oxidoreductase [Acidimicrobiales bacterium]
MPDAPLALITGASRGLGAALARSLAGDGWSLVIDARDPEPLAAVAAELRRRTTVLAVAGDIADPAHRRKLVEAVDSLAGPSSLQALVHNASTLGPSPRPGLDRYPPEALERVYAVNVVAPLALTQLVLPRLGRGARVVMVTSDAGVEAYPGWGGYGSSKAALEHLSRTLAAEHPELGVYQVDPGDMRTRMQAEAFPGEDLSDRPPPEDSVPGLRALLDGNLPSGRYHARRLAPVGP